MTIFGHLSLLFLDRSMWGVSVMRLVGLLRRNCFGFAVVVVVVAVLLEGVVFCSRFK